MWYYACSGQYFGEYMRALVMGKGITHGPCARLHLCGTCPYARRYIKLSWLVLGLFGSVPLRCRRMYQPLQYFFMIDCTHVSVPYAGAAVVLSGLNLVSSGLDRTGASGPLALSHTIFMVILPVQTCVDARINDCAKCAALVFRMISFAHISPYH